MNSVQRIHARIAGMLAASVGAALFCSNANAALMTFICDDVFCAGNNDVIVTDQGPGDNFPGSATVGQINSGAVSFNGFTIVTNVAQQIGTGATPELNLTFSAVTNDSASHALFLYASATGFTGQGLFDFDMGGNQGPVGTGNTVRGRAWGGTSNTSFSFSGANLITNSGVLTAAPFQFASDGPFASGANPYSLTIGVDLTRVVAGTTAGSINFAITPVPEPGTLLLMGVGVVGLLARRRLTAAS